MKLFVRVRGRSHGPFDESKLHSMVEQGRLTRVSLVSEDGENWQKASEFPYLFSGRSFTSKEHGASVGELSTEIASPEKGYSIPPIPESVPPNPYAHIPTSGWHYTIGEESIGPVPLSTLRQLFASGQLGQSTFLWHSQIGEWREAHALASILGLQLFTSDSFSTTTSVVSGPAYYGGKSKVAAGILALLVGGLGIHKFYLGSWGWGIVYLVSVFVLPFVSALVALVEGIIYLTMSEEAFDEKYNYRPPEPFRF